MVPKERKLGFLNLNIMRFFLEYYDLQRRKLGLLNLKIMKIFLKNTIVHKDKNISENSWVHKEKMFLRKLWFTKNNNSDVLQDVNTEVNSIMSWKQTF